MYPPFGIDHQLWALGCFLDRIIKHNCLVNYRRQDVFEKAIVEPFTCYADAFPKAKYYWSFEEGNFTTVGSTLTFRHGIRRYQVPKIQQTKMLVTYQRFGDLFLFGMVWQYSTNQNHYNKGTLISLINMEVGINVEGVQKLPNH